MEAPRGQFLWLWPRRAMLGSILITNILITTLITSRVFSNCILVQNWRSNYTCI